MIWEVSNGVEGMCAYHADEQKSAQRRQARNQKEKAKRRILQSAISPGISLRRDCNNYSNDKYFLCFFCCLRFSVVALKQPRSKRRNSRESHRRWDTHAYTQFEHNKKGLFEKKNSVPFNVTLSAQLLLPPSNFSSTGRRRVTLFSHFT
jgi:tRNA uridine 5-carbamoylmethylation protein Kti12